MSNPERSFEDSKKAGIPLINSSSMELSSGHEECHFMMKFRMKKVIDLLKEYELRMESDKKTIEELKERLFCENYSPKDSRKVTK